MSPQPLTTADDLKPGDVCVVSVKMRDKTSGEDYWWKRFVVVMSDSGSYRGKYFDGLTLKLRPDPDKDLREIDIDKDVVVKLEEDQWPQGVVAMHMKLVAQGVVSLT